MEDEDERVVLGESNWSIWKVESEWQGDLDMGGSELVEVRGLGSLP